MQDNQDNQDTQYNIHTNNFCGLNYVSKYVTYYYIFLKLYEDNAIIKTKKPINELQLGGIQKRVLDVDINNNNNNNNNINKNNDNKKRFLGIDTDNSDNSDNNNISNKKIKLEQKINDIQSINNDNLIKIKLIDITKEYIYIIIFNNGKHIMFYNIEFEMLQKLENDIMEMYIVKNIQYNGNKYLCGFKNKEEIFLNNEEYFSSKSKNRESIELLYIYTNIIYDDNLMETTKIHYHTEQIDYPYKTKYDISDDNSKLDIYILFFQKN